MIPPFNADIIIHPHQLAATPREIKALYQDSSFEDFEGFCFAILKSLENEPFNEIRNLQNLNILLACDTNALLETFNHSEQFRALKLLLTLKQKIKIPFEHQIETFPYYLKEFPGFIFSLEVMENNQDVLKIDIRHPFFLDPLKEIKEYFSEDELYIKYDFQEAIIVKEFLIFFGTCVKELSFSCANKEFLNQFLENCPRLKKLDVDNAGEIDEINLANLKELTDFSYQEKPEVKKNPTFSWSESLVKLYLSFQMPFMIETLPSHLTELSISGQVKLITAPLPYLTYFCGSCVDTLEKLPSFSSNLKILYLDQFYDLKDLTNIPDSVESLFIIGCQDLEIIDFPLPNLKNLVIANCLNLKKVLFFPETLEHLEINNLVSIDELPQFPEKLQKLMLGSNLPFEILSKKLPKNLKSFDYNINAFQDEAYLKYLLDITFSLDMKDNKFALELAHTMNLLFHKNAITKKYYESFVIDLVNKIPLIYIISSIEKIKKVIAPESFFLFHMKIWNQAPFIYMALNHAIMSKTDQLKNMTQNEPSDALAVLSKKINISKLNKMMEKQLLKKESLIPSEYDLIVIEDIFPELFNQINFKNPEEPYYLDPTSLKDGKTVISPESIEKGIFKLITNIKEKKGYVGVPEEPLQKDAYYRVVRRQLKQFLALAKNAFSEKHLLDPFLTARAELIKIAIGGHYCGTRWLNDPKEAIKVMTGDLIQSSGSSGIEDLFENWIKQYLFEEIQSLRNYYTRQLGISNEIHIHNQIGRLLSECGIIFEEGIFQVDDPIKPIPDDNILLQEIINGFFSPVRLTRKIWNQSIPHLKEATNKINNGQNDPESLLLLESFPEMMRGIAEKILASKVTTIEKKLPMRAFLIGKEILKKKLEALKFTENDSTLKVEERPNEFFAIRAEIIECKKILENEDKYKEKLEEIGMESARNFLFLEKQLFLDDKLRKIDLFIFDQDTFEMNVTTKGIFFALDYLGFLI